MSYANFGSIMEAIEWVKMKRRDRRFVLREIVYQSDNLFDRNAPVRYQRPYYEGSTDAELLGMRY
ncbi:MAG: hypothetical protein IKW20_06555 [Bacteroidales bacterium]|nr:hypothetical protein [Bacteroidales bacterium]